MVETQTDGEDNQDADNLGPRVKAMDPGTFVEVEENIQGGSFQEKMLSPKFEIRISKSETNHNYELPNFQNLN
jgi:hypothetical protein